MFRTKPYQRFTRTILGVAGGVLLLFGLFNTRINPLWVTPTPWTDEGFAEYRPIYRQQRTAKAGLARTREWDVAFFGSSRIDVAFDPELPGWGDQRVVNLAMSAGTLPETAATVRYTLERNPIELAIVGIDAGDLTSPTSLYRSTGFMESPFNPKGQDLERELRYLVGVSSFEASVKAIEHRGTETLPEYTPQGHRLRHQDGGIVRNVIRRDAIPYAMRKARGRKHHCETSPWKVSLVRQILDDTKSHGVRLVIVIPPNHASYMAVYYAAGDPDPTFAKDREALVALVEASNRAHPGEPPAVIWDFRDFHELNCEAIPPEEPKMHWWLDGTHARKSLGDIMQARIMGWPVDERGRDFGVTLDTASLPGRLEQLEAGFPAFKSAHPGLWEWTLEAMKAYRSAGEAETNRSP